jgi:hypothetical protein
MTVRLYKHEAVPNRGSFEVRFSDGRPSRFFYWDDQPGRRLRTDLLTSEEAEQRAKDVARREQDNLA